MYPLNNVTFLLGSPRSGTTWLGNILNSSPDILYFFEPFEHGLGFFDDILDMHRQLGPSDQEFAEEVLRRIPCLVKYKSLLFRNPFQGRRLQLLESRLINLCGGVGRLILGRQPMFVRRYNVINRRPQKPHMSLVHDKSRRHPHIVIKETRLAGKISALRAAKPATRFVFIIRHPCGVVHSTLRWMARGLLREHKGYAEGIARAMEEQSAYQTYRSLLDVARHGSLAQKIALHWRIQNEQAITQLKDCPTATVLTLEELSCRPLECCAKIFDLLGLPMTASVKDHITLSSTQEDHEPGVVDTIRNSATQYRSWREKIEPEIEKQVMDVVQESRLMSLFEPYYMSDLMGIRGNRVHP